MKNDGIKYLPGRVRAEIRYQQRRRDARRRRIVIQLRDRLGNQMFIYALYLKLKSLGRDVTIDTESFGNAGETYYRKGLLSEAFGITLPEADGDDIRALLDQGDRRSDILRRKLFGSRPKAIHEADYFCYDERLLTAGSGYFTGWFQNARYFDGIESRIRESFRFRPIPEGSKAALETERAIRDAGCAVSIHMRFGDYLKFGNQYVFGNICTEDYYRSAVKRIRRAFSDNEPVFFIFSDEREKAAALTEKITDGRMRTEFVNAAGECDSWIDMYLMSLCRHNIIANSTFSWWAAWLNANPEKTVISPKEWFRMNGKTYQGPGKMSDEE